MRKLLVSFNILLFLIFCGVPPVQAAPEKEADVDEEKLQEELNAARAELNEAARRVAELSRQLSAEGDNFIYEFSTTRHSDRAMLGIAISTTDGDETDGDKKVDGIRVVSVTPGGPADKAGIRSGDILVRIGDQGLAEGGEAAGKRLTEYLSEKQPGDEVTVEYLRGDDRRTAKVETEALGRHVLFRRGPMPFGAEEFDMRMNRLRSPPPMPSMPPLLDVPRAPFMVHLMRRIGDMELASLTPGLGRYFGTDKGLLVVRAPKAEDYKLQDGDVILKIDGREPENAGHALRILSSYNGGETLELEIMRDKKRQTLEIQVPERKISLHDQKHERERGLERKLRVENELVQAE